MKNPLFSLFIAAILWPLLFSCKKDTVSTNSGPPEIKVGVVLPLTGGGASAGESALLAAELAVDDINTYLRNLGSDKRIRAFFKDSGTDSLLSLKALNELEPEGIHMILGPFSSSAVEAVKPVADMKELLLLSPASAAISLAIANDNVFRLIPDDRQQAMAIAEMLEQRGKAVLIPFIRDDIWASDLLSALSGFFIQAGGSVLGEIRYHPSEQDFSGPVAMLASEVSTALAFHDTADVAVIMLSYGEGTSILHTAHSYDVLGSVEWFSASGFAENKTLPGDSIAFHFSAKVGLICSSFGPDPMAVDKLEPVMDKLTAKLGRKPEMFALNTYDALWLFALTDIHLSSAQLQAMNFDHLRSTFISQADHYYGITGRTSLNEAGDRKIAYYDFWATGGSFQDPVWTRVAGYSNGMLIWQ